MREEAITQSSIVRMAIGTAVVIVLLILATWAFGGFTTLSTNGGVALVFGITVTVALGVGLMILVFYSSRSERDEAVHLAAGDGWTAASNPASPEPRPHP